MTRCVSLAGPGGGTERACRLGTATFIGSTRAAYRNTPLFAFPRCRSPVSCHDFPRFSSVVRRRSRDRNRDEVTHLIYLKSVDLEDIYITYIFQLSYQYAKALISSGLQAIHISKVNFLRASRRQLALCDDAPREK